MNIRNEDILELTAEIPEGHKHVRTTLMFEDGRNVIFQEATIANLVRAFLTVKTHPLKNRVTLIGKKIEERKAGYAEYQLVELER